MHPWIGLSDEVRLGLLTEWVTPELVDEVLAECGKRDARPRPLSSRFMVYYALALALFQQDSYDDVAENLVGTLGQLDQSIPNKSSFTRARTLTTGNRGSITSSVASKRRRANPSQFGRGSNRSARRGSVFVSCKPKTSVPPSALANATISASISSTNRRF